MYEGVTVQLRTFLSSARDEFQMVSELHAPSCLVPTERNPVSFEWEVDCARDM